jgi:type II secretory pathway pseudopilin PulG
MPRRRRERDARGETLIELLVAMTILGIAVVALVGGIGTSVVMSDIHRKQATAEAVIHTYAEAIEGSVAAPTTSYVACPTLTTYGSPPGFTVPSGFTATVTAIAYREASGAFATTCSSNIGIQRLTLSVRSGDAKAKETLNVFLRTPCRTSDATCS